MEKITIVGDDITDEKKQEYVEKCLDYYKNEDGLDVSEMEKLTTSYLVFKRIKFFKDNESYFKSFKLCDRCYTILPYGIGTGNVEWYKLHSEESDNLKICQECYESKEMEYHRRNYILIKPKLNEHSGLIE